MKVPRSLLRLGLPTLILGTGLAWGMEVSAQTELPALRTSRPALERPPSYEPVRLPAATVNSRSSARGTSRIPDPAIFDGSQYPEEERPEQAMIAQFENPGGEPPPPTKDEKGPGQQKGGGGPGPGGDGGPPGGGGGPQIAGLPPIMGGGGGEEEEGGDATPPIPESQMGDQNGGGEGPAGEPGESGPAGSPEAPQVAEGQQGRQLDKPSQVQIGDENAKLAEADTPQAEASRQLENEQGENRMSVQAASGSQPTNRGTGTERGVDIPSNL